MRLVLPYNDGLCLGHYGYFPLSFVPKIYISPQERNRHLYVLGITGTGKSKFLEGLILQDILAGRGCGVIDPHSDLVRNIYAHLNLHSGVDWQRIFYLDINAPSGQLPFNILATPGNPYDIAQLVIEAFRRTWSDALKSAPQFSNIMLASLVVLIKTNHTLIDVHHFLTDNAFRARLLAQAQDPEATEFFTGRFDKWGKEAPLMIESTLNKVSAFSFNPVLKKMLGHKNNALDFRSMMDNQQVLLADLGGEAETRRLLGSLLVTFMEYAAFSRRTTPTSQRIPFYLYMDEFQDFSANDGSAKTLSQILSEARKFGLLLTLAHQSLSQLQTRLSGALGNVQTKVLFGMSRGDAEIFAKTVGKINKRQVKETPKTNYQHPVFESLPEQWEDWISTLQWQRPRRAHVVDREGKVFPLATLPLANPDLPEAETLEIETDPLYEEPQLTIPL